MVFFEMELGLLDFPHYCLFAFDRLNLIDYPIWINLAYIYIYIYSVCVCDLENFRRFLFFEFILLSGKFLLFQGTCSEELILVVITHKRLFFLI